LRFTLQRTEHQEEITVSPLAKLADMLLHLTERYGHLEAGDSQLELRLTRGELAAMIGCPRSQAEEAINTLESKNILSMRGTKIAIHDLEGLRQITQAQP
jgi:CRP-like cAMP-binding protein